MKNVKIVRFDLPINGTKVKNLEELRDNLTDEILALARSSQLERWLRTRQLPEQAQAVATIVKESISDKGLFLVLCKVLEVEAHPDDVKAIFDAPPEPGRLFREQYFDLLDTIKKHKNNKSESIKTIRCAEDFLNGNTMSIHAKIGDKVKKGDLLIKVNHQKKTGFFMIGSTADIVSPISGVILEIFVEIGQEVRFDQHLMSVVETFV